MAAATLSLRLHASTAETGRPSRRPTLRRLCDSGAVAFPSRIATSLRMQTTRGASVNQRGKVNLRCQAGSVDKNNDASVEPKAEVEESSAVEKQGPPFLTITASVVVAALLVLGLWLVISAIRGIFFH